jgi:hypothetical protein
MVPIRVPAWGAGALLGALAVDWFGMWEPGRGFWQWEPLVAVAGLGVVVAEIAAIIADSDYDGSRMSAGEPG